jgi:peptidoglycan hydrolase-like protein with peptidoglycan-binding domain
VPSIEVGARRRIKRSRWGRLLRLLVPSRWPDAIALCVAVAATLAVLVNALALQRPPLKSAKPQVSASTVPIPRLLPPPRPEGAAVQARAKLVLDVQSELTRLGYYDGAVDGRLGPRTDQAIRDFERAHGLRISGEPNEPLLGRIRRAPLKSDITGAIPPKAETHGSHRVMTVQRVLARLGYGPLRLNGVHDADTRASIQRFERDRNLPPSGAITDRLVRELAAVTGAPVE